MALARQSGDAWAGGVALQYLGLKEILDDHPERAGPLLDESRALLRQAGDVRHLVITLTSLAALELWRGDLPEARRMLAEALYCCRTVDEVRGRYYATTVAAHLIRLSGNRDQSQRVFLHLMRIGETMLLPRGLPELDCAAHLIQAEFEVGDRPIDKPSREVRSSARLSPRELQVLALVAAGLTNADIARERIVSARTARFHVATILDKLGATNRAQAVALGLHQRLIDSSSLEL